MKKKELAEKVGERIISSKKEEKLESIQFGTCLQENTQWMERIESGNTNPTLFIRYIIAFALDVPLFEVVKI